MMTAGPTQLAQQAGQDVGLHRRLGRAGEAHVGLPRFGRSQRPHVAEIGDRLRQLADALVVLLNRPPGVMTQATALGSPMTSYATPTPSTIAIAIGDSHVDVYVKQ